MAEFGEQLKKAREEKGYTQQTLADMVYVSRQTISRWESGSRYPDIITLKSLSTALGVSTDELLSNESLPQMVEKSPVVERPAINNCMVALYAFAVLFFLIQTGIVLTSLNDLLDEIRGGSYYTIFMAVKDILEAGLLGFGFVNLLKGTDTPRKSGAILLGFFGLEALSYTHIMLIDFSPLYFFRVLVAAAPYAAGAVGAYLYFLSRCPKKPARFLIYFGAGVGIYVAFLNLFVLLVNDGAFVTVPFVLSLLLRLALYVTFCYQTYVLGLRRKAAKELSEK